MRFQPADRRLLGEIAKRIVMESHAKTPSMSARETKTTAIHCMLLAIIWALDSITAFVNLVGLVTATHVLTSTNVQATHVKTAGGALSLRVPTALSPMALPAMSLQQH